MQTNQQRRPTGVLIPEDQQSERTDLPELTITEFGELRLFGGTYVENGRKKKGFFIQVGGVFYLDPDGPAWIGRLKPLSAQMQKNMANVMDRLERASNEDVPVEDKVDVLAGEVAKAQTAKVEEDPNQA